MIAAIKSIALLHLAGTYSGLLVVPVGIVLLAFVIMAVVLIRDHLRRRRCPHDNVQMVRQQVGGRFYFVEVCMACRKTGKVPPSDTRHA